MPSLCNDCFLYATHHLMWQSAFAGTLLENPSVKSPRLAMLCGLRLLIIMNSKKVTLQKNVKKDDSAQTNADQAICMCKREISGLHLLTSQYVPSSLHMRLSSRPGLHCNHCDQRICMCVQGPSSLLPPFSC